MFIEPPLNVEIEFPAKDGPSVIESVPVSHLGEKRYLAEGSAVFGGELYWHDEFQMECSDEDRGRFIGILKRSGLRVETFVIPKSVAESEHLKSLLGEIAGCGGNWEIIYGGVLLTHIPADARIDVQELLNQVVAKASG